jgi:hypothetical protein
MHDWFSRTGQGYGGEYRYVASPTSSGNFTYYQVSERAVEFTRNGQTNVTPGGRNYNIRANARQGIGASTRVSAQIDYFSSVATNQLYQQDFYQSTLSSRSWSLASTSNWAGFTLLGAYQRAEYFYGAADSQVTGVRPRVGFSRSATRLGPAPVYVGGSLDYSNLIRESRRGESVIREANVGRVDGMGVVRVPFPAFPFLTVNSSLTWRGTRYDRSVDPVTGAFVQVPIFRRYMEFGTEIVGPSAVRIWHRPNGNFARKLKHIIEPRFEWRRLTTIDTAERVVKFDSADYILGGSAQLRYGVTTRILVKGAAEDAVSRSLLNVSVFQTYYTDPRASQVDPAYGTSFLGRAASSYSPISISAALTPAEGTSLTARVEYDPIITSLQSISIGGGLRQPTYEISGTLSQRRLADHLAQFMSTNLIGATATVRTPRNTFGTTYMFNYDFGRSTLIQQRIMGYYNAQCCGIGLEYQEYSYPFAVGFVIPQDRRFNLSFSLAGIGSFSNFLGALTGQPTRR